MAINRDFLGRVYESAAPYEVTRIKIAEFADAIGDANPIYRDVAVAKAAGYTDVIAPPTFPVIIGMRAAEQVVLDPELGLDFSMVVHGDQRFRYSRPVRAGDVVRTVTTIFEIRALGRNEVITLESEISTVEGEHVVTAINTLVARDHTES